MHYHHHCLVTFISTIVWLTFVHDVTGSGSFEEETKTERTNDARMPTTTPESSANSLKLSWITVSSISVIVIGLINGHLRRFIF
ncbi:unnamed protein product [Schistosoma spindalis]|nr:unnamed protein product [Schistosoma spindale]